MLSWILLIISYFIGMASQTNQNRFLIGTQYYEDNSYNWFYPVTNCLNWLAYAMASLVCIIGTIFGFGYYLSLHCHIIKNPDDLDDMFCSLLGSLILTFVCGAGYFALMYMGFEFTKQDSILSIIFGFALMLFCSVIMGGMSKAFNLHKPVKK